VVTSTSDRTYDDRILDGNAPVEYKIEGKESMGNGGTVRSGHASVLLSNGKSGKLA